MRKYLAFVLLAFLAVSFSKSVLAEVVPTLPATMPQEDIVVVLDDDFLQQQSK